MRMSTVVTTILALALASSAALAAAPQGLTTALGHVPTNPAVPGLVLGQLSSDPPVRGQDLADQIRQELGVAPGTEEVVATLPEAASNASDVAGLVKDLLNADPPVRGKDLAEAIRGQLGVIADRTADEGSEPGDEHASEVASLVKSLLNSDPPVRGKDLSTAIRELLGVPKGEGPGDDGEEVADDNKPEKPWPNAGLAKDHSEHGSDVSVLVHELLAQEPRVSGQDLADAIHELLDNKQGHEPGDDSGDDGLGGDIEGLAATTLATPGMVEVPEPATMSLLVLAGLAALRRRRR